MTEDRVKALMHQLRAFAEDRDWEQFHSPKNLTMALGVEVAELAELFQWMSEEQSRTLDSKTLAKAREEIGDIQIYLARIADQLGIDPMAAASDKFEQNAAKYPAERVRGSSKKYTEYGDDPEPRE